jgi:hypothetical protein
VATRRIARSVLNKRQGEAKTFFKRPDIRELPFGVFVGLFLGRDLAMTLF